MGPTTRLLAECDHPHQGTSFYTSAQWTADGTTVLTSSSDQTVHAFALPDDLLSSGDKTTLQSQGCVTLPEPSQIIAPAPYFSLLSPTTQHFLAGCLDHPLQLYNCFPNDEALAPIRSYKLIKHETEAYITPSSVLWQHPGTHFVVGSMNRLDLFDITGHASDGPVTTVPTIPSRRHIRKGNGIGMKGTVSALSSSADGADGGIIAAGTRTRWIGMYDLARSDKTVANWSIAAAADQGGIPGQGITQTAWSPCGRYLVVSERHGSGLLVYDVRGTGQLLSILKGRRANTQQRLSVDVFPGEDGGFEVWAGGDDGRVCVWEGVGLHGDFDAEETWGWKAHDAPVGSVALHSSGSVVASCSGGWEYAAAKTDDKDEDGSDKALQKTDGCTVLHDSALRVWSLGSPQAQEDAVAESAASIEAQELTIHGTHFK